ncbi:Rap family tetratricopeptide repeat protein [Bacillus pseudomycoides]|uniref:response regulator aspartate phosphatase n=1 Tax=Bacillus pseudomycoides TaxID=64104 RepID=UPI001FB5651A|nr:Rap family tetratricopeptide repeat protein [Bacillus pseudomycoides]
MSVTMGSEKVTKLLNDWYVEIRSRNITKAHRMKEQIDSIIQELKEEERESLEDKNLLLYYSLLDFRYSYLIDNVSLSQESFDKIESFKIPKDEFLSYYYHFFKAIHKSVTGRYNEASEHFDKAEEFLKKIPDELEVAEFYYKLGSFYYDRYQGLLAIKCVSKAKEIYRKFNGCEINIAFCENLLGLDCTHLKEWELAEEHFATAMNQFQKIDEEYYILMVRHNFGLLYASQNLSTLAIRYLSEVVEKKPKHYKAILIKAKEHFKLKEHEIARDLIEKGLQICNKLKHEEYQHRFMILEALNGDVPAEKLEEVVLAGVKYFEREELYTYMQDSMEELAIKFYQEDNHFNASKYFYLSTQARKKAVDKEALK